MTQISLSDIKTELKRRITDRHASATIRGSKNAQMKCRIRANELAMFLGWLNEKTEWESNNVVL